MASKTYCPGSGHLTINLEKRVRWYGVADRSAIKDLFVQCPACTRILVPTGTGKLRRHQPRGRVTASLDRTRDTLWAHAYEGKRRKESR